MIESNTHLGRTPAHRFDRVGGGSGGGGGGGGGGEEGGWGDVDWGARWHLNIIILM